MHVTINVNTPLFLLLQVLEESFRVEDLWMIVFLWTNPLTIEVDARNGVAVIATDYTIGIENRDY